jgi:hypothetical protein
MLITDARLSLLAQSPLIALAVARAANLCNDLAYPWTRTPRPGRDPRSPDLEDLDDDELRSLVNQAIQAEDEDEEDDEDIGDE